MLNFCTLFDSNYLSRGLLMYESLRRHCSKFHLYVFAFDDACYEYLLKYENHSDLTIIPLSDFEDEDLLRIKPTRDSREYCWTCTSSTILYCIETFNLTNCTYIDADVYFYSDPTVLIEEMGENSVLITAHRYTPEYDQSEEKGKFCVQFVAFKNDERGMKVLRYWRNACIEWCYARAEDGKCGDQKYLDAWSNRFEGIHELQHLGGGVAPWNIQQYSFVDTTSSGIVCRERQTGNIFNLVFYHFHGTTFYTNNIVRLTGGFYKLNLKAKKILYIPYVKSLTEIAIKVKQKMPDIDPNGAYNATRETPMDIVVWARYILRDVINNSLPVFKSIFKNRNAHHHFYYTDHLCKK